MRILPQPRGRAAPARRTAGGLYFLYLGFGLVGAGTVALLAGASLNLVHFEPPTATMVWNAVWAKCEGYFMQVDPVAVGVLFVLGVVGAIAFLALRSLTRQSFANQQLHSKLTPVDTMRIGGTQVTAVEHERPEAFCMGYLRPRIFLSTGAIERLSGAELEAVVAHEQHHVARRDPLRLFAGRAAADALFFLPALRRVLNRYAALSEVAADEAAVQRTGTRPLASALLTFGEHRTPAGVTGIAPAAVVGIAPERVDYLGGAAPRWSFSVVWLARWLGAAGLLFGLSVLASMLAHGRGITTEELIGQACYVSMTAGPVALGALFIHARWRRARARRTTN